MKCMRNFVLGLGTLCFIASVDAAELNVKTVNFKECVELSKSGQQEQAAFDALKKQMENVLVEKEKTLNEMASKFEDPDYLDSLSPEAETEMKRKFRALNQEYSQLQSQYYQTLQQTNMKVMQKLQEQIMKAAETVAKDSKIDIIMNSEGAFYSKPELDISNQVVTVMNKQLEEANSQAAKPAGAKN